jgi:hypothetical protein
VISPLDVLKPAKDFLFRKRVNVLRKILEQGVGQANYASVLSVWDWF